MKRKAISIPLLILFLSICLSNALAKPVDTLVAKHVALNFMAAKTQTPSRSTPTAQLIYTGTYQNPSTSLSANCFYIFSTSNGFVIVSADDRIEPILGYSTEGRIDLHGMPVNMEEILDGYTQEIKLFLQNATPEPNAATEKWRHLADNTYMIHEKAAVIGPLLKTRWNQSSPYNLHCPDSNGQGQHALTGCVATAMAQILRYWEYPTQGTGSKSYICDNASSSNNFYGNYGRLTVDFSIGNYNYNYMPNVIDNSSPSNQINAVAKLSYHCGVSVQMTYGIYASEAATSQAVNALSSYFKYSTTYNTLTPEFKNKSSYSDETDWVNLIKSELNAWRPVIYSGSGSGGHAFICDGYDNQGYFHFNWGWGGYLDGYFLLTALTPTGHNYNYNQSAIIHIQGNTPLIRASADECSFISPVGGHSNSSTLSLCGVALSSNINASVPSGFQISTDDIHYGNTLTLGSGVSQIYVRYVPTLTTIGTETAVLSLSSGTTTKTIALTGRTYELDCNPPQNVQGTHDDGTAHLSWTAPTQTINTYRFSWDSTLATYYNVSNWTIKAVHRMTGSELINFHKKQLTQVSFYACTGGSSYKIVVFKGGSYVNGAFSQGTQVISQSVSSVSNNRWNTITLDTPVDIDANEELWYGVQFTASSSYYPLAVGSGTYVPDKGSLIYIEGYGWMIFKNLTANAAEVNFPLIAIFQDAPATITDYTIDRNDITIGSTTSTSYQDHITTTGTYTYNITANWSNGCSATSGDITMSIITDCTTSYGDTTATVCGPFTWHGVEYTETPVVAPTFTYQTSQGCDSIVTLHLTINHAVTSNISATACENYTWNGQAYTQSGNYTQTFTAANGCDSVVTLHLTINHAVVSNISATACENYTWNGQTYTQSGNYTQTFTAANGCDSVVTLHLTINHAVVSNISATACENYTWNGQAYTQSGNYTQTFTAANGCDSVVTLHLTINHAVTASISATACESYSWNGQTYTQSGNYTQTFTAANGCDSVVTLHLITNHAVASNISATACENYTWNGQTYTQSGNYTQTFTAANGCDSVVTLHLTINHAVTASISATACESYTWNGQTYTKSGNYTQTFTAANGCDSVVTLHLTINHAVTTSISATACESYTWNGQTYTQSGNYTQNFTAANGCDSVVTLHLTINHAVTSNISATACENYTWNGQTYTQSGHYTQTFTAANSCDSVVTLHLIINHAVASNISATACENYTWNGQIYTKSGDYTQIFTAANGCDSMVTLHLTINHAVTANISATACENYTWNGQTYTQSGNYTQTFTAANGCDSVVTLHLTINHAVTASISATACESYTWNGQTYTKSGHYTQTFTAANGCDSVVTLHLTINQRYYIPENITVTQGSLPYLWHGRTFYASATAYDSLTSGAGCDSVHFLNLSVTPFNIVEDAPLAFCQGDSQTWRGRTLTQAGEYRDTVLAENTIHTVTVTVNPTYYIPENITVTQGSLPYRWHGRDFYASTTAYDSLTTEAGCDSVHFLNLTVTAFNIVEDEPIAFCQGDSQTWRGHTLTQAGEYRDTVLAENTIHTVVVIVNPTYYIPENITVTQGSLPYHWHGRDFYASTTAYDSLTTEAGCDSVHFLNLTVTAFNIVEDEPIAFCQGNSQTWRGRTLTQAGEYRDTVLAENTIYTVMVTVNPTYYIPENITVTQGSLPYRWHGRDFYASTTAYDSLTSGAGCDSVHFLNLSVTAFNIVEDSPIAFCHGDSQNWRGRTLTQAGDYRDTVLAENTIYTVVVTVNPTYYIPENITATQGSLPYHWHGRDFYASTTAYDSLTSGARCDSVHFLNLTVTPFNIVEDSPIAFCQGGSQTWRGRTLTQAGEYRDTVLAENTIYTVTVTVNPTYYIPENITVTQGSLPYHWHGRDFYASATAYDSLTSGAGCDSVYFLNLTVTAFSIVEDEPIAFCQGDSQTWRGRTLTQAGEYRDTVLAENTIHTVTVTVNPTYYIPENITVTQGSLPYLWHGRDFYESATAYDSLTSGAGCDSVHFLNLSVTPFSIVEDSPIAFCQGGSQTWRGRTLTQAGEYRDTVLAENTIYTVTVTVNPTYYIPENVTVTQGSLPYHWHGRTFYESATAYDSLTTEAGCDSVHFLNLTVTPFSIVEDEPIAFCQGNSQTWRGRTLTQAGEYRDTVLAENTIYTVTVTVNPTYYIPENVTVTQGSLPYHWHGRTFYESATAYDSLTTEAGCDSVHCLNLSVTPFSIVEDEPIAFCQGDSQTWRGRTLTQAGEYRDTVLAENTIYTVVVTVNPTYAVDTTVTITTNDLPYHFVSGQIDTIFSSLNSQFSTFNFQLSTIQGCDSIITLHLTIVTGIAQHPMEQTLRAFPNPTSGLLTVTGDADFTQVQLFDAYGRKIGTYSVEDTQIEIDLHGLANGVYFIKAMRHRQMIGTLRIIKNGL